MNESGNTSDDVLVYAIALEAQMIRIFESCGLNERCKELSSLFIRFAEEEKTHKQRLENLQKSGQLALESAWTSSLCLKNYPVLPDPSPSMAKSEALLMAMAVEKTAYRLYSDLSAILTDPLLKSLFDLLAQEESQHKLRFELEYDRLYASS